MKRTSLTLSLLLILFAGGVWGEKSIITLECVLQDSSNFNISSLDVKIDLDNKVVDGLLGLKQERGFVKFPSYFIMRLNIVNESDNSFIFHQEPINNNAPIMNHNMQMRWSLNRSTGRLSGYAWHDTNRYWERDDQQEPIIADCSKVNSKKLF